MTSFLQSAAESTDAFPIAENLLGRVLEPYSYKRCRYLIDAMYRATADSVLAYGNFRIDESAYIRGTGHFNAVELVLCFNQLGYSTYAQGVVSNDISALRNWSITDYCRNQLSSILIKSTSSQFKKLINPQKFSARLHVHNLRIVDRTWRYLQLSNTIEFWDDNGGSATGEFEVAILNIP
ncbi:FcoT family thioesterase [Mycobacterium uberis]|uniref:FcoT family thioesterase n=1 Tax=Mycobacterium uberis TaxID=2162698 RepID=UPI003C79444C